MSSNKDYIRRIANDVKYIYNNKIDGIYYKHDETNLLKGRALIIGPKSTPYSYGFYFFEINFTTNYPYEPPKVMFLTNDGHTRFHPNLYSNGKVCLSLLNTWKGEGWTSCQNITSILLILMSIMDENPLLHEPGVVISSKYVKPYNDIINYMNIKFSVIEIYEKLRTLDMNDLKSELDEVLYYFKDEINYELKKNYENISLHIENLKNENEKVIVKDFFYTKTQNIDINYNVLLKKFNNSVKIE